MNTPLGPVVDNLIETFRSAMPLGWRVLPRPRELALEWNPPVVVIGSPSVLRDQSFSGSRIVTITLYLVTALFNELDDAVPTDEFYAMLDDDGLFMDALADAGTPGEWSVEQIPSVSFSDFMQIENSAEVYRGAAVGPVTIRLR